MLKTWLLTLATIGLSLGAARSWAVEEDPTAASNPDESAVRSGVQDEAEAQPDESEADLKAIREEGMERSQVMETLSYLTDVIGPRLTASPGMKRANEWTRDKLEEWGLENAHLEAWGPFGRGWTLEKFSLQVTEPLCFPLISYPKAWTPGIEGGPVTGPLVVFEPRNEEDLEQYKGKLKGAILLSGRIRPVEAWFKPPGERFDDAALLNMANAPGPRPRTSRNRPTRSRGNSGNPFAFLEIRNQFLIDEGAVAVLEPSFRGDGGTLFVQGASVPPVDGERVSAWSKDAPKTIPQITVASEHFNRLIRMVDAGEDVKLTIDLEVEFHEDDDLMGFNTVAEIPGSDPDLKPQLVMLGGHMDSWHSGTGATDNAAGVSACMEAVRILKAAKIEPKRTIRIALWSGEEQGLYGSRAYVAEHFGDFESDGEDGGSIFQFFGTPDAPLKTKPEYDLLSAYYNLDNGTGKVRGVYMEGNEEVRGLFRDWLAPFAEMGASTLTASPTGGTDHMSFDRIGLPGFQFIQDPVEYDTRTHHSNMDVFDRIQEDDMKQDAVILATFLYLTANRDELIPRKSTSFKKEPAETADAAAESGGED